MTEGTRPSVTDCKRAVERTDKAWRKARSAVLDYAIAQGHGHTKYNELGGLFIALDNLLALELATRTAHTQAESAAVQWGYAWRGGTFNSFEWYGRSDLQRFAAQRKHAERIRRRQGY